MEKKITRISLIALGVIIVLIIASFSYLKIRSNMAISSGIISNSDSSESLESVSESDSESSSSSSSGSISDTPKPEKELRGVWIATVYNIDFPSKQGLSPAEQKTELDNILNEVKKTGFNAVFFQVRPSADALYDSNIFPVSAFLTGQTGSKPTLDFDPLKYITEQGHSMGIEVHAWINPLRVTTGTPDAPKHDVNDLPEGHPAREHPDWVVPYADGKLYFDPGIPQVRQLVIDGVTEILSTYNVDGIHFDDYFYPYPKENAVFDDTASYSKYKGSYKNKEDFRRGNIDQLIKGVYDTVKAKKTNAAFGVSPFAVWANKQRNSLGSATSAGIETYYDTYADTRKWVKSNWLDYICPQIYWSMTFQDAKFTTICDWWDDVTKGTNVKLYTGHAGHKVANNADKAWDDPQELAKQVIYARKKDTYKGSIFYGFGNIKSNPIGVRDVLTKLYD